MLVVFHTNHGDITLRLNSQRAPISVENFLTYCRNDFYANTVFHRVINDFMIQGGGFTPEMKEKTAGAPIKNEANNGLLNRRGTIAMARTQDPHSATAQFFINVKDNAFLNFQAETTNGWGYCVFGEVIAGMSVVDAIKATPTRSYGFHDDVPIEPVILTSVSVGTLPLVD